MPDLVETLIEDDRWQREGLEALAETACRATLARLGLAPDAYEISLLGCDDARIAVLNADFRGKPSPTNVLSWPAEDLAAPEDGDAPGLPAPGPAGMAAELGDIAIAHETCAREAAEQGKSMGDHVTHLLVHGCLHLLGYDHIRPKDAALMEGLEVEILATLGLADPYG
ncbi:rRNA maturation factor [Rhodovulum sp. NI22]|nr:rRNA maturation factor [Rhodovulum sp. NI22]